MRKEKANPKKIIDFLEDDDDDDAYNNLNVKEQVVLGRIAKDPRSSSCIDGEMREMIESACALENVGDRGKR